MFKVLIESLFAYLFTMIGMVLFFAAIAAVFKLALG